MAKKIANEFVDSLETTQQVVSEGINYSSLEWLKATQPFFPEGSTSAKCSLDREPKVQEGLAALATLLPELSETFIELGKWWENKDARREIKKMIDAEAAEFGYAPAQYLLEVLRPQVTKLANLQSAIERLSYITTFFKPRENAAANMLSFRVDGRIYKINRKTYESIVNEFDGDKEAIRNAVKEKGIAQAMGAIEEF